ncbi:hypothetical protein Nepgr_007601 [Nepenthes gracilis]|uniref:Stigma-specific Stig1 family protein n=1 Tax=Nepenthes gracilis TaxID=150966 RepID=A0AAD3XIN7_NEPGR|nr:hypothetical protein Nepgr_007601 [Nepenthes gracilis]
MLPQFLLLVALPAVVVEGSLPPTKSIASAPWLRGFGDPRAGGCWTRPWICSKGGVPSRRLCCRNRCVDITDDVNNCGFCGVRCPFTWQCCRGICINTNINPFHCGRCWNRCPFGRLCFFGMCGYAQPPFPFPWPPFHPHHPFPPKPPRLPFPLPPQKHQRPLEEE